MKKHTSVPRSARRSPPRPGSGTDRCRVCVERVTPAVDEGRFSIKRVVGEDVVVEADVFADGHDVVSCVVRFKRTDQRAWRETPMAPLGNDRWRGTFTVPEVGRYAYRVEGWIDSFTTWHRDLEKRAEADTTTPVDLHIGAGLLHDAARRATGAHRRALQRCAAVLAAARDDHMPLDQALNPSLVALARRYPDRTHARQSEPALTVLVERPRAGFSAWYEMFPRSCGPAPDRHGTLRDCIDRLDYVASMGFDVLYLPPVHPIGLAHRKGRNNAPTAETGDVGSPWAIGSPAGGHTAIHPELGTLDDFDALVHAARDRGLEIALDIAFQCSPDHPWVTNHPAWFRQRPDGSIQYAENPPKKYQDIYPIDFDTDDWRHLWAALCEVFLFWAAHDVRIFRVDNPHTKPFRFWEWVIDRVRRVYPDAIFLAEAFTRPKVMYELAKSGFSQSYTYFTWRNTKAELTEYFTELTETEVREFFRPNLWPNTPDILHEYLQYGGRPAFMTRVVLAATLGANYGIYGPAFELFEHEAREAGSEEYRDSEKYEIRARNLDHEWTLRPLITRLNQARRDNPALQRSDGLQFHPSDNDQLLCYSKVTADGSNAVVVVVNLDYAHTQSGWVTLDLAEIGLEETETYQMHDLVSEARYLWQGRRNYVELNPHELPAHVFRIRRRTRTEKSFDYFQ